MRHASAPCGTGIQARAAGTPGAAPPRAQSRFGALARARDAASPRARPVVFLENELMRDERYGESLRV